MKKNREIRKEARQLLKGKWLLTAMFNFVFLLIIIFAMLGKAIVQVVMSGFSSWVGILYFILLNGIPILLIWIWFYYYYCFTDGQKLTGDRMVRLFHEKFWMGMKLSWLLSIFIFLWELLYSIFFIGTFRFFGGKRILNMVEQEVFEDELSYSIFMGFAILFILGLVIIFLWKYIEYQMSSLFLFLEDDWNARKLLAESKRQIKGYRWAFLKLQLSFLPWFFLSILTLGIGSFFFASYWATAVALFLRERREELQMERMDTPKEEELFDKKLIEQYQKESKEAVVQSNMESENEIF